MTTVAPKGLKARKPTEVELKLLKDLVNTMKKEGIKVIECEPDIKLKRISKIDRAISDDEHICWNCAYFLASDSRCGWRSEEVNTVVVGTTCPSFASRFLHKEDEDEDDF